MRIENEKTQHDWGKQRNSTKLYIRMYILKSASTQNTKQYNNNNKSKTTAERVQKMKRSKLGEKTQKIKCKKVYKK